MDWNMQVVAICQEFGWTYDEFMNTPMPFIDLVKEKMRIDAQRENNAIKNSNKKINK